MNVTFEKESNVPRIDYGGASANKLSNFLANTSEAAVVVRKFCWAHAFGTRVVGAYSEFGY